PLQRTGQHQGEGPPRQQRRQRAGLFLAVRGEGQVGAAGVPPRPAPLRLTVPRQQQVPHASTVPSAPTRRRGRRTGCAAPPPSSSAASPPAGRRTARTATR